ncbi:MAG TPA: aldehyde reductase [Hellea balneolensis]|uniref:Aldehyde reductase n=1 Tax=Hellea balneolensis TaxID=287478 RepID=A0A7C5LVW7_9PROT|nr:aldehyde reductase [Hellea balneolensis]
MAKTTTKKSKTGKKSESNKANENSGQTVLVTGASGFIAKHCIIKLLNAGYQVRGSLRTPSRAEEVLAAIAPHADVERLSFVTLDLGSDEGWDKATRGCTYVMHVASPFPNTEPNHEDDLIIPARDGALRALRAAAKSGVKRTVMTSSTAAVAAGHDDLATRVINEDTWSNIDKTKSAYMKSKTIAERAAWDFINSEAANGMELAVINPGAVLGPLLDKDYSTSGELVRKLISGEAPACPNIGFSSIDVRDVAEAHLRAMTMPEAAGKRFILISKFAWMIDISKALHAAGYKSPTRRLPDFLVRILAMFDKTIKLILPQLGEKTNIDNTRLRTVLGIEPRGIEEMSVAMAKTMIEYGVVKRR